jgi:hypothetical protein
MDLMSMKLPTKVEIWKIGKGAGGERGAQMQAAKRERSHATIRWNRCKRNFNQLLVSYEESERDWVDKELCAFLRRYVGGRNWCGIWLREKNMNQTFVCSKNRSFRTPRISVGFNELKHTCLIFVKVMKKSVRTCCSFEILRLKPRKTTR